MSEPTLEDFIALRKAFEEADRKPLTPNQEDYNNRVRHLI